jgi:hypothetical protein
MNDYRALKEQYGQEKAKVLKEKTVTAPLCPPQIPQGLAWDQTWTFAVKDQ